MKELTIRNGSYYIGEKTVQRGHDVAGYSVFYKVGDYNDVKKGGHTVSQGEVFFVDDNMDVRFSVQHIAELDQKASPALVSSHALAVQNG